MNCSAFVFVTVDIIDNLWDLYKACEKFNNRQVTREKFPFPLKKQGIREQMKVKIKAVPAMLTVALRRL